MLKFAKLEAKFSYATGIIDELPLLGDPPNESGKLLSNILRGVALVSLILVIPLQ